MMNLLGVSESLTQTYSYRSRGVQRQKLPISKVTNLEFLQDRELLKTRLTISREYVGVPTSPGKLMRLPPIVMRVRLGYFLSGCTLQTTLVRVISLRR